MDNTMTPTVKLPARPVFGAPDPTFSSRVSKYNRRRELARKRSLFADTKANRKLYGTYSANFKFTPAATDNRTGELPPWLAAWPAAVLNAEDLRKEGH